MFIQTMIPKKIFNKEDRNSIHSIIVNTFYSISLSNIFKAVWSDRFGKLKSSFSFSFSHIKGRLISRFFYYKVYS